MRRRRRARHHRAPARRRASHPAAGRARHRRRARAARAARRVQHRRRSASRSGRAGDGGAPGPVHARAGAARRDHQPGRLVGVDIAADELGGVIARDEGGGRPRQRVRGPGAGSHPLGARRRRRPRRALHRAVRARVRARARRRERPRSSSTRGLPGWRTSWGSASTPVTTSTCGTSRSSTPCRTSTRCRSATRSSGMRCMWACGGRCSTTWPPSTDATCDRDESSGPSLPWSGRCSPATRPWPPPLAVP